MLYFRISPFQSLLFPRDKIGSSHIYCSSTVRTRPCLSLFLRVSKTNLSLSQKVINSPKVGSMPVVIVFLIFSLSRCCRQLVHCTPARLPRLREKRYIYVCMLDDLCLRVQQEGERGEIRASIFLLPLSLVFICACVRTDDGCLPRE